MTDSFTRGDLSKSTFEPLPASATKSSWPTVLGVISIILGGLGLLIYACGTIQSVGFMAMAGGTGGEQPPPGVPVLSMGFSIWSGVNNVLLLVLGIMLLVGGIGLLSRKVWAVSLLRLWAWVRIVLLVIGIAMTFAYQDEMAEMMTAGLDASASDPSISDEQRETMEKMNEDVSGVMSSLLPALTIGCGVLALIWPVVTLVITGRRREEVQGWG